jgi:hypothetical protein
MLSVLDAIPLFFGFCGILLGSAVGYNYFGILGGIIGALLFAAIGVFIGSIPRQLSNRHHNQKLARIRHEISKQSTEELIEDLRLRRTANAHFIIAELSLRNYKISSLIPLLVNYLSSNNISERVGGWASFKQFLPNILPPDYSPSASEESRRFAIKKLASDQN